MSWPLFLWYTRARSKGHLPHHAIIHMSACVGGENKEDKKAQVPAEFDLEGKKLEEKPSQRVSKKRRNRLIPIPKCCCCKKTPMAHAQKCRFRSSLILLGSPDVVLAEKLFCETDLENCMWCAEKSGGNYKRWRHI